jgi:hypothetical protein
MKQFCNTKSDATTKSVGEIVLFVVSPALRLSETY